MEKKEDIKNKKTFKEFIHSTMFLKIVFSLLLVTVLILSICIYQKKKEIDNTIHAHMIIPVIKKESEFEFGIDTKALSKEETKEYVFKVTNYKDKKINKEELSYHLLIENPTPATIKVTVNDAPEDLMKDSKVLNLDGKLGNEKQEDVYFHVYLTSFEELKDDDFIYINITS